MNIDPDYTVSVTDLARKTSRVLNDVIDNGETYTILKDNTFAAAVVPFDRYRAMQRRLQTLESRSRDYINEPFRLPEGLESTHQSVNSFPTDADSMISPSSHLRSNWQRYEGTANLSIAVGMGEGRRIVRLNLADVAGGGIGPHGSVSGDDPSIAMESLILSLALRHSPTDVTFAVLDASGAGTPLYDRNLRGLPHFVETSNDASDPEFHDVISAEIDAREELLTRLQARDHAAYRSRRGSGEYHLPGLPTLFVVVLGSENDLPEDLTALLRKLSHVGRGLGIHLLLDDAVVSTQLEQHLTYRFVSDHGGHRATLTTDSDQEPVVVDFPTMTSGAQMALNSLMGTIRHTAWDTAPLLPRVDS